MSRRSIVAKVSEKQAELPVLHQAIVQSTEVALSADELVEKSKNDIGKAITYITGKLAKGSTVDHPLIGQVEKALQMVAHYSCLQYNGNTAQQNDDQ